MKPRERGLSLIEILVTLTIVAFGVLGLLGLQARALSFQKDSFDRKAAAEMIAEFAERARMNYEAFTLDNYLGDFPIGAATPAVATCAAPCTAAQTANRDLSEWRAELRRRIPGSAAYVRRPAGAPWVTITVAWPEPLQSDTQRHLICDAVDNTIPANYRCYSVQVLP
jgi:type IV pilus assembly protein PilV